MKDLLTLARALRAAADVLEEEEAREPTAAPAADSNFLLGPADVGVTPTEWRRAIARGELVGVRVSKRYVARRVDVAAWLTKRVVTPKPPKSGARIVAETDPFEAALVRARARKSR